jgi:hypothetical protein
MKIATKLENDKAFGKVEVTVHVHGLPKGTAATKAGAAKVLKAEVVSLAVEFEKIHRSLKSGERKMEYTESFGTTYNNITLDIKCDALLRGIDGFSRNHRLVGLVVETAKEAVMGYIEKCISGIKPKS